MHFNPFLGFLHIAVDSSSTILPNQKRKILWLSGSVVRQSHAAAVLVMEASAQIDDCLLDGVLPGTFHTYDVDNNIIATYENIGDGLVAFLSYVQVDEMVSLGASRAGVIFDSTSGALVGASSSGARFGLVVQGEPRPEYADPSNVFSRTETAILADGNLPVPGAPPMPEER